MYSWEQSKQIRLELFSKHGISSLAINAESQIAKFVAKILRVCSGLVVLMYCTW